MAIRVQCTNPQCQSFLDCPDEYAGQEVECSQCRTRLVVPKERADKKQMLGNYELVRKLGQGGMGAVFEAIQVTLGRRVALKLLLPKFTKDSRFLERFQREAKAAAILNHPNIIQVFDIGEDKGHYFFAMELVEGESVIARLKREGKLPLKDALYIVGQVASALNYACQHSIIHRDVKPDNILVSREGYVKLADMGLAKSVEENVSVTQTGIGIGSPYYMAPEQARDATHVDHRADIYALGITLLQLLTGKRPFDGPNAYAIVMAHAQDALPTAQDLGTAVPAPVEALIRKMSAKVASERFQDYPSLLAELERVQARLDLPEPEPEPGLAIPAEEGAAAGPAEGPRPIAAGGAKRPFFRKAAHVAVGGLAIIILIVVGVFAWITVSHKASPAQPARPSATPPTSLASPPSPVVKGGPAPSPVARASEESPTSESTQLVELWAYVEKYAEEHPEDFREIIRRFEKIKEQGQGNVFEMKAADQIRSWQEKWEQEAETDFENRQQIANKHLKRDEFAEAQKIWLEFPDPLRTESIVERMAQESVRIKETALKRAESLSDEAKEVLSINPMALTRTEFETLTNLKTVANNLRGNVSEELEKTLEKLAAKLDAAVDGYQQREEAARVQAFETFWNKYEGLMRKKEFDQAEALANEKAGLMDPALQAQLMENARAIKALLAQARENMTQLIGKNVQFSGITMKVEAVREGKVITGEGKTEKSWDLEKIDARNFFEIGIPQDEDPSASVRKKILFGLFFGRASETTQALKEAAAFEMDVSFYESRLTPVLVVSSVPAGATIEVYRRVTGNRWEKAEGPAEKTPCSWEIPEEAAYKVEVNLDLYQTDVREIDIKGGGQYRIHVQLRKDPLPASLKADFEIASMAKDQHGNPVRKGWDEETGLALEIRHKATGMHLVFIPSGKFLMGSASNEKGHNSFEHPQHLVSILRPFYLGKYELIEAEWIFVKKSKPTGSKGDSYPVIYLARNTCWEFLTEMNTKLTKRKEQGRFVLPSDAQWEYACRAGTRTRFYFGDDFNHKEIKNYAWVQENSLQPVGRKKPNAWGLYDMSGNIAELCQDPWHHTYEGAPSDGSSWERPPNMSPNQSVVRGGTWGHQPDACRSAARWPASSESSQPNAFHGFRVAFEFPESRRMQSAATSLADASAQSGGGDRKATEALEEGSEEKPAAGGEEETPETDGGKEAGAQSSIWQEFETLIKGKRFAEAANLASQSESVVEEDFKVQLAEDAGLLQGFFARASENMAQLTGKTVRLGGSVLKVADVREGKIYVNQGEVEMGLEIEKVDVKTLLELVRSSEDDPQSTARTKLLFVFYFGTSAEVGPAIEECQKAGLDVSFYQSRFVPVLSVSTQPPEATVKLFKKTGEGKWEEVRIEENPKTPVRLEVEKNSLYRVETAREGYFPAEKEITVKEGGEFRVSLKLSKDGLPASLRDDFEVPAEKIDKAGNPVRRAAEKKTGLPLEIRQKEGARMHLVLIPAGEFMMGAADKDAALGGNSESPQHRVKISRPFYMGKYEVTKAEWTAVTEQIPSWTRGNNSPVENVSWDDCAEFVKELNESLSRRRGKIRYAIPTEAQWEYACRAGTRTHFFWGDDHHDAQLSEYVWYQVDRQGGLGTLSPVGKKKPNPWGLYDMLGNCEEWCADAYSSYYAKEIAIDPRGPETGTSRMTRGGSVQCDWISVRCSSRNCRTATMKYYKLGFRLILEF